MTHCTASWAALPSHEGFEERPSSFIMTATAPSASSNLIMNRPNTRSGLPGDIAAILYIDGLVFIPNSKDTCEGTASFHNDGDGNRATDTTLTFLHPQIGMENGKDILRAQGLRDIPKGVDRCMSNASSCEFNEAAFSWEIMRAFIPMFASLARS